MWVHTFLGRSGTPIQAIEGTEVTIGIHGPDAESVQVTGGQTFMALFQAGDEVTLHGRYSGEGNAAVLSNGDGRTGVVARWVSPGF